MTNVKVKRKDVLSHDEITEMFKAADRILNEYRRLRARAILSLFITGKRRQELATLEKTSLKVEGEFLYVTFIVVKKRMKKRCRKCKKVIGRKAKFCLYCGESLTESFEVSNPIQRTKRFPLKRYYARCILEYHEWIQKHQPNCRFLFPSVRNVFAIALSFSKDQHLRGRQILNIIKDLNPNAWCHLFRETRGAEVIKEDERKMGQVSIFTVYKVKHALDLEKETTAWNYVNRFATETIASDLDKLEEID